MSAVLHGSRDPRRLHLRVHHNVVMCLQCRTQLDVQKMDKLSIIEMKLRIEPIVVLAPDLDDHF